MCNKIREPSKCSQEELENFYQKVLKSEQVQKAGLRSRIKRAKILAFHYEENTLVSIAALKQPDEDYKKRVFRNAGVSEEADKYNLELGWVFTEKEYRGKGIGSGLVQRIIDEFGSQNIFSTTETRREDELPMTRILEKNGFEKLGKPYQGSLNRRNLQMYIRRETKE